MKRGNLFASAVILLLLAVIGWLVFSALEYRTDRNYGFIRTKVDESQIATALEAYSTLYGAFPTGNTEAIERILSGEDLNGKNLQKIRFLTFKGSVEHSNEMADPWGTPYAISFSSTNSFVISSAGKDKVFGDKDDIVFNSVSNDIVKP
jgi:type II secretory pathway pseudopilin PulG